MNNEEGSINESPYTKGPGPGTVHTNVEQEYIYTTEDKIRLCLIDYSKVVGKRGKWPGPLTTALAFAVPLFSADFKNDYLNLNASQWELLFIIGLCISIFWLIITVVNEFSKKMSIDDFVNKIKRGD